MAIIPASGLYPCAGMASLPRASCPHILQTLERVSFSFFAVRCCVLMLFVEVVSLCKARLKCPL